MRTLASLGVSIVVGCAAPAPAQEAPPASSAVAVPLAPLAIASAAPTATVPTTEASAAPRECVRSDERRFGSTCCQVTRVSEGNRFAGQTFLSCDGPQIGRPCKSKRDCDVACSCDGSDAPRDPRDERSVPKEGTKGLTGFCSGRRQIGVWMCDIDENGAVTHIIVD